jgi:hypothetical protein
MYIKRDFEDKLKQLTRLYPAVLVTGARQTGKTSLTRHLLGAHRWVPLDQAAILDMARRDPGLFLQNHPPPVIIDEAQKAPELFPELKFMIDDRRVQPGQLILTGSQPLQLMSMVTESLAGRVGILELPPMALAEIFDAPGRPRTLMQWLDNPPLGERFPYARSPLECLLRGGFPAMALPSLSPRPEDAVQRLSDYIQTYLSRDLRDLAHIDDLGRFERFLRQLSIHASRLLNVSEVASGAGIPQSTADQWVGLLEASHLFWSARGYARQHTRRERKGPKGFLVDSGLHASLLGYTTPSQLVASPLLGAIFETAAANSIRKVARSDGRPLPVYHWRYGDKEEVDLIVELSHDELCLVEFKWTANPTMADTSGIMAYRQRYRRSTKAVVVTTAEECFWLTSDILHLPWSAL